MFKHKKLSLAFLATILAFTSFITGCEEEDLNTLAVGQQCFNNVSDSALYTEAVTCYNMISSLNFPEAYALKCAMQFRIGGITTSTLTGAIDAYEAASGADKEAVLMDALALNNNTETTKSLQATAANNDCKLSEVPGLVYFSSLILIGTKLDEIGGADTNAQVDACKAAPSTCATAEVGEAIVAAEAAYCLGDTANETICQELNQAIQTGGSDYQAIAVALMNLIDPTP